MRALPRIGRETKTGKRNRGPDNDLERLERDLRELFAESQHRVWEEYEEPRVLSDYIEALKLRGYSRVSERTLRRYNKLYGLPLPPYSEEADFEEPDA
jgi:hypothetical protein